MGRPSTWCYSCSRLRTPKQLGSQAFNGGHHCSVCAPEKHGSRGRRRPHLSKLNRKLNRQKHHQSEAGKQRHKFKVRKLTKESLRKRALVEKANAERRRCLRNHFAERYLVRRPARPTLPEVNDLATTRVAAAAQGRVPADPVLCEVLFCSPLRDQDSTTAAVRRAQRDLHALRACSLDKGTLLWLHVRAWRAFGTERFVDELGAVSFKTLQDYQHTCVHAAHRVWSAGFHAFQNAYGQNGVYLQWLKERTHWRLADRKSASALHRNFLHDYWRPVAAAAWEKAAVVCAAARGGDWRELNTKVRCKGAGVFSGLQLAKDLLDAPGWPQLKSSRFANLEDWYPVEGCPGTIRGLRWIFGKGLKPSNYLSKLAEVRDLLNDDRRARALQLPEWGLCSTAHWLCEVDKYVRARTGAGKPPRLRCRNKAQTRLGGSGGDSRDFPLNEQLEL